MSSDSMFENKLSRNLSSDYSSACSSSFTLFDEENCADSNNCDNAKEKLKIDNSEVKSNGVLKKLNAFGDNFNNNIAKIKGELEVGECNSGNNFSNEFRRNRTSFSDEQLKLLQETFHISMYPDENQRKMLMNRTGLDEDKIITWFSNRRARWRKLLNTGMTPSNSECFTLNLSPSSLLANNNKKNSDVGVLAMSTLNSTQIISPNFQNSILLSQMQNTKNIQENTEQLIFNQQLLSQILSVNWSPSHIDSISSAKKQIFSTDARLTTVNTLSQTHAPSADMVPLILAQEQERQNQQMMFFINQLKYQATIAAISANNANMAKGKIN